MEFKRVLEGLITAFREQKVRYALMGGFAMGLWGMGRSTVDLDFLVHREDIQKLDGIMSGMGYECKFRTENVSQYVLPLRVFGEVDFLHAFREPSLRMLERAVEKVVFGDMRLKVLQPEDIIGLKLQAIKNNTEIKERELADIVFLAEMYAREMDWTLIDDYVKILKMEDIYEQIRRKRK